MAATEPPARRGRLLAVPLLLLGVLGLALAVGAARRGDVPGLPALPETTRDDVRLVVGAERDERGRVLVELDLRLDEDASPLRVAHESLGDGPGPAAGWNPPVHAERLPAGQVVLHAGASAPPMEDEALRYEMPTRTERILPPGGRVSATMLFDPATMTPAEGDPFSPVGEGDLAAVDEVRVCVWAADVEPAPGGRPATCADAEIVD